ncbi:ABC transporter substrate-binding protein [Synechococcus sp. M16CYN]
MTTSLEWCSRKICRRHFLQIAGGASLVALAGCRRAVAAPQLLALSGILPKRWTTELPKPWQFITSKTLNQWTQADRNQADLLAFTDGWIESLSTVPLQPIAASPLRNRLDAAALRLLEALGPQESCVLPVGVSPWVMLVRQNAIVESIKMLGWEMLLDPHLQGRIILPASPLLVINLADRLEQKDALERLRRQVLTFDDRQAVNWLLKGVATVVVLPLQRCLPLLKQDPRVAAVLPAQGAPLNWTMLARPFGTQEPLPQEWVEQAWREPLRRRLLQFGWRAPLPTALLETDRQYLPERWHSLMLPPAKIWDLCWSLPRLKPEQQISLRERWQASTP